PGGPRVARGGASRLGSATGRLAPDQRGAALARMAGEVFDVVVVGGGVTGVGCALDAATRGLTVALIEARDFASGTSSRSSKLVHGGLRYLEMLDVALVREALAERHLLLSRLAPHLVHPVPFLYPLRHRGWERAYVGSGLALYDALGGARSVPRHRHLSRHQALRVAPGLRRDALVGAVQYHDAQTDDARYVVAAARSAAHHGAVLARSVAATGFVDVGGTVAGVVATDLENHQELVVRGRQVVNATGVWTDDTQQMGGARGRFQVRASKGVHVVVPRDRISLDTGLILRTETSVLFVIPWGRHWIIGTTDTDWNLDKAHPAASRTDVDYLLGHLNAVLRTPVGRSDVEGVYAGLRPLLGGESASTSNLSRRHAVSRPVPGLVVVAGGKFTTYRVMARDAIDAAAGGLPGAVPPSCTAEVPLLGADGYPALRNHRLHLAAQSGLHVARIDHLLGRYGSCLHELLDLIDARPELAEPLPGGDEYLGAEVVHAVTHEGALHLEDVLARRTRLSFEAADRGLRAAEAVAGLMGAELGWDEATRASELERYRLQVHAEREAEAQPDDRSADAARLGAPDPYRPPPRLPTGPGRRTH
ncbi:MAG TPA: glycerol-3-phosphate dehydrogenase/oxidase, partial [Acidimicrobiales bacterium]|nr:glycerol-3-phosphate dehydrogenase/oxidase [Acidimicrobiales bacterium]